MFGIRTVMGLLLALFLCCANALPAWSGDKSLQWDAVPAQSLTEDGMARVIVGFAVQKYDELSAASAQYKVLTPEEATAPEAASKADAAQAADASLAAAINQTADAVLSALPAASYKVHRTFSALPFMAISITPKGLEALKANPGVTSIEVDELTLLPTPVQPENKAKDGSSLSLPPTPEIAPDTAPLAANLNWGITKVGAETAWSKGYTGKGWYVAILDTGIRRTHEFFAGKTIVEACFSINANCPGGTTTAYGTGSAAHYANTLQGYDHGTHCAGIATGKKADGSVTGVAKDANLIAIQVFSITSATSVGSYSSDQLAGLNYVYSLRNSRSIAAASMSLGGGAYSSHCDSNSLKVAIDALRAVNIATTIATGNNYYCGYISGPACISSAIAVGASTSTDTESAFSNWDDTLQTIFAPGSGVYSSTGDSDTSYESWDGTSMATPHVAGAWALLRQNRPSDSVTTILNRVLAAGTPVQTGCSSPAGSKPRLSIPGALLSNAGFLPAVHKMLMGN